MLIVSSHREKMGKKGKQRQKQRVQDEFGATLSDPVSSITPAVLITLTQLQTLDRESMTTPGEA